MPKLEWYDLDRILKGNYYSMHSEFIPSENTVLIRSDDPGVEPHIAIAHELGHITTEADSSFAGEVRAWEEAIYHLMSVGEWTKDAKAQAIWALSGYVGNDEKEAEWWIKRMENRARERLRR